MGIRTLLDARMMVLGPLARAHGLSPSAEDTIRAFTSGFARSGGQMVQVVPNDRLVQYLAGKHPAGLRLAQVG